MSKSENELIEEQNKYRALIDHTSQITKIRYVAGADLTCERDKMLGCLTVLDLEKGLNPIYSECIEFHVTFPYIPGFLAYREGPVVIELYMKFKEANPTINIDLLLVDGSGEWHPRAAGLACYVGLKINIPCVGVSKTFLNCGSEHNGKDVIAESQNKLRNHGDVQILSHQFPDGFEIRCGVMRTTSSSPFKPIYISVGHMINLESAIELIKPLCQFREPEPLRLADRISRKEIKKI